MSKIIFKRTKNNNIMLKAETLSFDEFYLFASSTGEKLFHFASEYDWGRIDSDSGSTYDASKILSGDALLLFNQIIYHRETFLRRDFFKVLKNIESNPDITVYGFSFSSNELIFDISYHEDELSPVYKVNLDTNLIDGKILIYRVDGCKNSYKDKFGEVFSGINEFNANSYGMAGEARITITAIKKPS